MEKENVQVKHKIQSDNGGVLRGPKGKGGVPGITKKKGLGGFTRGGKT